MLEECPHCHLNVLPKADGKCPACQRYFSDLRDIDPNIKSITINNDSTIPNICINCGTPTKRLVTLNENYQKGGDTLLDKIAVLFFTTSVRGIDNGTQYHMGVTLKL